MMLLASIVIGVSQVKEDWSSATKKECAYSLPLIILNLKVEMIFFVGQAYLLIRLISAAIVVVPWSKKGLKFRKEKECASPDLSRDAAPLIN